MGNTNIEWCRNQDGSRGWTVNPVKGLCPMACGYCYARRMYKRFGWNPEVRYTPTAVDSVMRQGRPGDRIFVGSTMELFGPWVPAYVISDLLENMVAPHPQRTFIFLTKLPAELKVHSPWPDNCWIGATVTDAEQLSQAYLGLSQAQASVKFISYEPLLTNVYMEQQFLRDAGIGWVIIGQKTPVGKGIPRRWVGDIVEAADGAGVPVFEKDNLRKFTLRWEKLRQEWPGG